MVGVESLAMFTNPFPEGSPVLCIRTYLFFTHQTVSDFPRTIVDLELLLYYILTMAPAARYESDDVSATPLGKPLEFVFSGKTAPNRLYVLPRSIPPVEKSRLMTE
jgi:hypothetical protein